MVGESTKEVQKKCKELSLIRVIKPTRSLARVCLLGVVGRQRLVVDRCHGADLAVAFVEDL